MWKYSRLIGLVVFLAATHTACKTTMTGIAPSTTPITARDTYSITGAASGRAYSVKVFFVRFASLSPSRSARDRAIANAGADALIEVTQDYTHCYLLEPVFGLAITRVRGTAVNIQRGGAIR